MSRGSWTMCNLLAEELNIHGTIFSCYVFFRKRVLKKYSPQKSQISTKERVLLGEEGKPRVQSRCDLVDQFF